MTPSAKLLNQLWPHQSKSLLDQVHVAKVDHQNISYIDICSEEIAGYFALLINYILDMFYPRKY